VKDQITIIPIAKRKLGKRRISVEWVKETIRNPEQIVEGHGGREVAQRRYKIRGKEYLLRVIYERRGNEYVIITAYLTSQIGRYWKGGRENEDRI